MTHLSSEFYALEKTKPQNKCHFLIEIIVIRKLRQMHVPLVLVLFSLIRSEIKDLIL